MKLIYTDACANDLGTGKFLSMTVIVRRSVLHVLAIACFVLPSSLAADNCVKQIFNRYCLGGAPGELPADVRQLQSEEGDRYEFLQRGKSIQLIVNNHRITSVSRREPPGSWLNFTDWKTKLIRLYGRAEDLSGFPAYAGSRSSKLNAINAGKGYALARWPQGDWIVSILWDHRDYIILRYDLSADSSPANDEGL